ncbi:FliM/FliN family flagellar motor switch protein [Sphingomonas sp. RHCKR7]|uniref:FliM/FliN family flagellar motor switch protein n=1 Tax=Sphingomonas folli TaxID=2862497 RepID=UPI001CA5911B|nr:FliM/FliN family flagellar motor switch protein [Sphingomonas folli]MBW6525553.1 FliM/FliN family flagellar motor switch protein [Sphingomonas folli]
MSALDGIVVELSVVLGSVDLPIRQVLKLSRGTMVSLDCGHNDPSQIHAGDTLIAEGRVVLSGEVLSFEVTRLVRPAA